MSPRASEDAARDPPAEAVRVRAAKDEDSKGPRVSYVIGRLDSVVARELGTLLEPLGLTRSQYTALSVLESRPGLSNAQMARRAMITPQSMSAVTSALEEKGLVARRPSPVHNRVMHVELTGSGRRMLARCDELVDELEGRMLDGLSEVDGRRLMESMRSCVRHLGGGL